MSKNGEYFFEYALTIYNSFFKKMLIQYSSFWLIIKRRCFGYLIITFL